MPLFGNGIDAAMREVKRLREARVTLATREQNAREELEQLRANLPNLALQDLLGEGSPGADLAGNHFPATTPSYSRLMVLDLEIRTCVDAKPALLPKLEAAIRNVNIARAAEIRKRADKLSLQLSEHRHKVEQLTEQLWSLEGVQFQPVIFPMGQHLEGNVPFVATKTMTLTQERDKLLAEADRIERSPVNQGGRADATDLDTVLAAVAAVDDIVPTPAEITAWYVEAFARADAEWNGTGRRYGDPIPMGVEFPAFAKYRKLEASLIWGRNGVISEHSFVRYSNRFEIPHELAMEHGFEGATVPSD